MAGGIPSAFCYHPACRRHCMRDDFPSSADSSAAAEHSCSRLSDSATVGICRQNMVEVMMIRSSATECAQLITRKAAAVEIGISLVKKALSQCFIAASADYTSCSFQDVLLHFSGQIKCVTVESETFSCKCKSDSHSKSSFGYPLLRCDLLQNPRYICIQPCYDKPEGFNMISKTLIYISDHLLSLTRYAVFGFS